MDVPNPSLNFQLSILIILTLSLYATSIKAQDNKIISIQGIVTGEDNIPLPGVNIREKGTSNGTITDNNGRYNFEVPDESTLVFSFVGYITEEIPVSSRSVIDIALLPELKTLKELVVVGYGVQEMGKVTGSAFSLANTDFNRGIIVAPEDLYQGKIPGVDVSKLSGEPGSDAFIRIRGANTIRAGNRPLIVIDGYPLDNTSISPPINYNDKAYSPLNFLNPEDIASIDVLKDASAAAIYGSRGSNGVLLITTKKGKEGEPKLTYNSYFSHSQLRKKIRVLTGDEFRAGQKEYDFNDILSDSISTDWQDEIYRNALTQSHDISFSAGTAKTNYRASISYFDQEGIMETTYLKRYTARTNIRHTGINDRLSIDFNFTYGRTDHRQQPGGYSVTALSENPTNPAINDDYWSSLTRLNFYENIVTSNKILSNALLGFKLLQGLNFKMNLGIENSDSERKYNINNPIPSYREGRISENQSGSLLFESYLDYYWNFGGDHDINVLGGYSWQEFEVEQYSFGAKGFSHDLLPFTSILEAGQETTSATSMHEKSKLQSFYGRFNYTYRDKYLLTCNYRLDGSSRFGENNQYGSFPSLGLGWRLNEEGFFSNLPFINSLKLRTSWGINGNQEIPNKLSSYVLGTSWQNRVILDETGTFVHGYTYERTPNPDLKWEETHQFDVGLDFAFLDHRLKGSLDYFDKRTTDLLFQIPVSNAPTQLMWTNLDATVYNRGFEVNLEGELIRTSNFNWTSSIVFTSIEGKIEDLPSPILVGQNAMQILENGEEIGSFYGYTFEGFDENGNNILKTDSLGNPVEEIIGHAMPDFTWGWTNTFQFRDFDFSIFINGAQGNENYNATFNSWLRKQLFPSGGNITPEMLNSEENFENPNVYSSRYIEDASFIRLNYATIGYNFNVSGLSWLSNLRLYVTGSNLWVWTSYRGYDPEVNTLVIDRENGIPPLAVDFSGYPRARSVQVGLNVTF